VSGIAELRTPESSEQAAAGVLEIMQRLYPICRSITGDGVRRTLSVLGERLPLTLHEVPSCTPAFDWEVPREWNIRDAWIRRPDGRTLVSLAEHTLRVVSYSTPVRARMSLQELRPHLHSIPAHPDWIPYRTSYYREDWGFCLRHHELEALEDGEYEVCIDSTLQNGSLTYAECLLPGESEEEFLLYTHVCHPSLCNDNLTGMALMAVLGSALASSPRRFTYRLVFAPGTIGSIVWLSRNEAAVGRIRHGLVLGLLGDAGRLIYKRSREGRYDIDRIAGHVLGHQPFCAELRDFTPYGYDERQFCSPGFNLPVGRLTRSPNGEYAEYHSSADNFDLIRAQSLAESLRACASIITVAEANRRYRNLKPQCEPRLGKRGLYRAVGGQDVSQSEHALLWVLNQSDGTKDLLDIAQRSGLGFDVLAAAAARLAATDLLEAVH